MPEKRISVVMPVFNEEQGVGTVLQQLIDLNCFYEIIAVDDGSKDSTPAVIARYPQVRLIQHPYNLGNGAAIKTGLRSATGDWVLLMDADGQHPPAEIPNLLQHIDRYDLVVGARTKQSAASWHRNLANGVFNKYASYIVDHKVEDLTSGFRVLNYARFRRFIEVLPNGFSYPSTMTIIFFRSGYTVKYQPFAAPAREGHSKIRPLRDGMRFLLTITRLGVLFVPMKVFLPISATLFLTGVSYMIYRLVTVQRFSGLAGLLVTAAIFVFLMGLIAEQISLVSRIDNSSGR